jgi:hypothetical protein
MNDTPWADRDQAGLALNAAKTHPPLPITNWADLITLSRWMADELYSADAIADAIETPWLWDEELAQAKVDLEAAMAAHPAGQS